MIVPKVRRRIVLTFACAGAIVLVPAEARADKPDSLVDAVVGVVQETTDGVEAEGPGNGQGKAYGHTHAPGKQKNTDSGEPVADTPEEVVPPAEPDPVATGGTREPAQTSAPSRNDATGSFTVAGGADVAPAARSAPPTAAAKHVSKTRRPAKTSGRESTPVPVIAVREDRLPLPPAGPAPSSPSGISMLPVFAALLLIVTATYAYGLYAVTGSLNPFRRRRRYIWLR